MKEYWVNVYEPPLTKTQFCGGINETLVEAMMVAKIVGHCVGRWHVKLKEQKPKRSWDNLNATDWMKP